MGWMLLFVAEQLQSFLHCLIGRVSTLSFPNAGRRTAEGFNGESVASPASVLPAKQGFLVWIGTPMGRHLGLSAA